MRTDVSCDLDVRYVDGRYWLLTNPFRAVTAVLGVIIVGRGFRTNFNSIPRGLWNILPPDDYAKAAVVHDKLYSLHGFEDPWDVNSENPTPKIIPVTRAQADQVHRELTQACGAPRWKANAMYYALRAFGWHAWNEYQNPQAPPMDPAKRPDFEPAPPPPPQHLAGNAAAMRARDEILGSE